MNFYNLDEVRSIPILDVCSYLGIPVEQKGGHSFWCKLRPGEKTASCKLYLGEGNEYDSFCDFGNANRGGDVIKFAAEFWGCSWQDALEQIAGGFNIAPINNTQYMNRNELTDTEWAKIGVYGDLATKNFDFDFEKFSIEAIARYSEKYKMSVEQLRKDYPSKYVQDILKKRAIPHVFKLRNEYYFSLYCCLSIQKSLTGHFDINNVSHKDLQEYSSLCKQLTQAEQLLKKALKGTDIKYSFKEYNVLTDLKKIHYGEIAFEIGDKSYSDMKRQSNLYGIDLRYRAVEVATYLALKDFGLSDIDHAGFLQNDKVNLVFLPDQSLAIDKCMNLWQTHEKLKDAVAIDYKGVVFDFWTIDDDGEVVGAICEHCAEQYKDLLDGELCATEGDLTVCAVKDCGNVSEAKCYQVVFKPELIQPLSYTQMQERDNATKVADNVAQRDAQKAERSGAR